MTERVKRRLTTVLCADVESYSRLMAADEAGTLAALQRCRAAMAALVERHEGHIVNTWGDAVIAEFGSVVEAVQCAVEIQQELSSGDCGLSDAQRLRFRIGIHLGDVMVDGADIYGDNVNLAARLQEHAEPGGILLSGTVYDQVRNKLPVGFDCLGWQHMKNVAAPVMGYRVRLGSEAAEESPQITASTSRADGPSAGLGAQERAGSSGWAPAAWNGFVRLPRPVAVLLALAAFLTLVNLFSGLHRIWFHWPVTPILIVALLWSAFRSKSAR
jgi:adenylate cyclase